VCVFRLHVPSAFHSDGAYYIPLRCDISLCDISFLVSSLFNFNSDRWYAESSPSAQTNGQYRIRIGLPEPLFSFSLNFAAGEKPIPFPPPTD